MAFSSGLDLTLTSTQRFIEQANFKNSWFMILTQADYGLNANAELIDIKPVRGNSMYTGRAVFRIDRYANNVPFNFPAPKNRYVNRGIYIKQITGTEIIETFGIDGTVYLGLEVVPASTTELAAAFQSRFGLVMTAEDILAQPINPASTCIMVTFDKLSVGYVGKLRVDLTTPVSAPPRSI